MIRFVPTVKYVYDVPQISSEGETKTSRAYAYTIPHMIEYITKATSALDRINRIYYCEKVKELTDADKIALRKEISYIYVYHHTVYKDDNFDPKDLEYWLPEYSDYIDQCPPINETWERFKTLPDIAPIFNGTGCIIM
jgi:hypothetical protein